MKESDDRGEERRDWGAVAHKGELSATVLTLACAAQRNIPAHREAGFVVILHPDGKDDFPVSYKNVADILEFMREMKPRFVKVEYADGETSAELAAILAHTILLH